MGRRGRFTLMLLKLKLQGPSSQALFTFDSSFGIIFDSPLPLPTNPVLPLEPTEGIL